MDTKQTSLLKVLAKHTKNFCLEITESGLRLKQKHSYYKQVHGVWGSLESHGVILLCTLISWIVRKYILKYFFFYPTCWEALKIKLLDFYLYAMVPELLTGRVKRGIPMYPNIFFYKWLKIITPGNNVYRFKNYAKSWLSWMPADIYVITETSHRFVNLILRLFTHLALRWQVIF